MARVLTLIGRGRSNAEIGQDLYLSPGTIRTHINRIFAKLGLRDRVQGVASTEMVYGGPEAGRVVK